MLKKLPAIWLFAALWIIGSVQIAGAVTTVKTNIAADTTWSLVNSPYYLPSGLTVAATAILTIDPGVVVKFGPSAYLYVYGALNANGTSESQVYFTSYRDDSVGGDTNGDASDPVAGDWRCIQIMGGGNATLDYTTVRYGGGLLYNGMYYGELHKFGKGSLTVRNSTFSNGLYSGIKITSTPSDASFSLTNNTLNQNGYFGIELLNVAGAGTINGNNGADNSLGAISLAAQNLAYLSGNTISGTVLVTGGTITQDIGLEAGSPYVVKAGVTVNSSATLTAAAGTVVKFGPSAYLNINGVLNANGTSKSQVYFTSNRDDSVGGDTNGDASAPAAGDWRGIQILAGGNATLNYMTVRYGGFSNGTLYGELHKIGAGSLTVSNSTISNGLNSGIYISSSAYSHSITNSTVKYNGADGIKLQSLTGPTSISGNVIRSNAGSGISAYGSGTNPNIQKNTLANNNVGVYCSAGVSLIGGSAANGNNIFQNSAYGVQNLSSGVPVDASYNWWGSASGPHHATTNPSGTGDKVSDFVNFGNFLGDPATSIAIGAFTPASYFKHVAVGASSEPQTISVTNSGNQDLIFGTLTLSGDNAGDYQVSTDGCSGKNVAPGAFCALTVVFAPTAKGMRRANLDFPSNDVLSSPVHSEPLTGYGAVALPFLDSFSNSVSSYWSVANPASNLSNLTDNPGNLRIFTSSSDLHGSTTNANNLFTLPVPSGIDKMMVTAKVNFPTVPSGESQQGGIVLLPEDGNKNPDLGNFVKTSYGFIGGALRFQTTANVTGMSSDFPGAPDTSHGTVWLRLVKRGANYQSLYSTDGLSYTALTTSSTAWDTSYVGLFAINGSGSSAQSIPVDFDSVAVDPLPTMVPPAAAAFGNVSYQSAPAPTQKLRLGNTGSGDLIISSLELSGSDRTLFSIDQGSCGVLPVTIHPGGACDLSVTLATSSLGGKSATLAIGSNDIDTAPAYVSLSGTLVDTTPPAVTAFSTPSNFNSLTVPITVLSASDNLAVTGYLVTPFPALPALTVSGWSATPPVNYTFGSAGSKTIYAWARDAAGNVSASWSAAVSVDTTPPSVTAFSMPPTNNGLTVPVILSATDNLAVTGFLISESSLAPSASAGGWISTPPISFKLSAVGSHTLYAFAKDLAGNVSAPVSATVSVTFTVTVQNGGTGNGSVHSNPGGIACETGTSSGCSAPFAEASVILIPAPSATSTFGGWSGDCNGTGSCVTTLNSDKTVTANFIQAPVAMIGGTAYPTLQAAYDVAGEGVLVKMMEGVVTGSLAANRPVTVTIKGGYSADYSATVSETILDGQIHLQRGMVKIEKLYLK